MIKKLALVLFLIFLSLFFFIFFLKFPFQEKPALAQSCQDDDGICLEGCSFKEDNDCLGIEIGETEVVFDWSEDKCEDEDIPDSPARAFVDADGKVQLIATHYTARRFMGSDLDNVEHRCEKIFTSDKDPEPRKYNDYEWLLSPYTLDGKDIYSLVHTEYHGWAHNNCHVDPVNCWWNSINLAVSTDKGRFYRHEVPPAHNIANSQVDYNPDNKQGPIGFFEPSNIISKDGYYYALMDQHNPPGARGTCLMRTNNLSDPKSWRFWDGSDFTLKGYEGSHPRCQVLPGNPPHSQLSYNTYLEKYIALYSSWDRRIWYSLSDDLIHWTNRKVLVEGMGPYVSLLDSTIRERNFEKTGRSPWLYWTRRNHVEDGSGFTLDRDLVRTRIVFAKPTFKIQGYKLGCPEGTKITLDGAKESLEQPYFLYNVSVGNHTVSLELPVGSPPYDISYSPCDCCMKHPDDSFISGSSHSFTKETICEGDYNYYDLYWQCKRKGDLNDDDQVNSQDLKILLENWGDNPLEPRADLNGDGQVNGIDFGKLRKLIL